MRDTRALLAAIILAVAAGCASQKGPPQAAALAPSPTLSANEYAALKARFLAANPDARVGRVAAVLVNQKQVAVKDLAAGDFRQGDVLSIVDGQLNLLANATVVEIDPDLIYARYTPATVGSRGPVVGDVAIRPAATNPSR